MIRGSPVDGPRCWADALRRNVPSRARTYKTRTQKKPGGREPAGLIDANPEEGRRRAESFSRCGGLV